MGLRLVYGRSGTGKSEFCFNEISKLINYNKKIYIITPEQFSFTAERKLMEAVDKKAVINAEVLTFNRLSYRVITEAGGGIKTNLSNCGKSILIYNILDKEKTNLKFLGKTDKNIDLISRTITELKKHSITNEMLSQIEENTKDEYLKTKLKDIDIMYTGFQNALENKYIDENDVLTLATEKIENTQIFNDSIIYIDEFAGFTTQEYKIIEKLLMLAKDVTITVCTDSLEKAENPDTDIFYSNKITIQKLIDLAKGLKINIEKAICLEERHRFKEKDLLHLEENIYASPYIKYKEKPDNISIFLAMNQYSEIEYIAKKIIKLVRDDNYRYKEIAVITKNIQTYSSLVKAIFNKYNIPVFIDEKKNLNDNILVKYIVSLIEVFSKNWSYEAMFNYIKSGFLDLDYNEMFMLENYCMSWGIKGSKWYNEEWNYGLEDEKQIKEINDLRIKIVKPLIKFKEKLKGKKTVEEITKTLYEFLIENGVPNKLELKIKELENANQLELANIYATSWNVILEILDELVLVLGNDNISFEKYCELLKVGLSNSGLGKIPGTADQVIVGDIDRSRSHKVKAIFVIGLNDGVFPSINKDEGFLDDKDRNILKQNGIELAKGTNEQIYDDNFNIYKAFSTAEQKLYLSYASTDCESKSLRASILISKIKKIFPNIIEESDIIDNNDDISTMETTFENLLINIKKYIDGEEINPIWFEIFNIYNSNKEWNDRLEKSMLALQFTNIPTKINEKNIKNLYGNTLKTSVSRLEQYKSCPFSFFLKYGLNISEKKEFKVQTIDTGTFMHDTIDDFFKILKEREINIRELSDEELKNIVEEIIDDKLKLNKNYIFNSIPKYIILAQRLKKVILKSMKYIVESIVSSNFNILDTEVEFGEKGKYPPIEIELDKDKKVQIIGKIDRIDIAENEEGKYIRIIDYKSSVKNIDLNEVIAGLQIQLLTYLDAASQIEDCIPSGVLYFNLIEPLIKSNKNMTDEEIEFEIKKKFKMQGLILADVKVVRMMDNTLDKGASNIIPAYIDKDDNLSTQRSNSVTKEQFISLQKYTTKIIKEISEEILSGNINPTPYYNVKKGKTPCDYCSFKAICQFNPSMCGNNYNYIPNLDKNKILENIKEEK